MNRDIIISIIRSLILLVSVTVLCVFFFISYDVFFVFYDCNRDCQKKSLQNKNNELQLINKKILLRLFFVCDALPLRYGQFKWPFINVIATANAILIAQNIKCFGKCVFVFVVCSTRPIHSIINVKGHQTLDTLFTNNFVFITIAFEWNKKKTKIHWHHNNRWFIYYFDWCFVFCFFFSILFTGQYIDLDYSIWLWRALTPLIICFLLPMVFVLLIYLSSCFLYIYKLHR